MHEIKSIEVFQTAKVIGILYGVLGVIGALFWFLGLMIAGRPVAAIAALIFGPFIYGIVSFIITALGAWLYNEVPSRFGGVQFELTQRPF